MPGELVTVATYYLHAEALLARSRLESAGIETYLIDEHMVRMDWPIAPALSGIKLQVRNEDAPEAREILDAPAEPAGPDEVEAE